ncbi:hypothetical protein [Streptomyces sp. RPA4-5]|uniref:hypothetical protein n=1 Tax=Streptomyces sp. RPA4-5 TaxID=2721245 RepID=UPI0032B38127
MLVVIDPVARSTDGESVRIAKDVLCAGAGAKICLPEGPEEFGRMLARRGHRRPVVIGDDRTLLRVVGLLHKERELAAVPLSMVPVGAPAAVALSRALGVPTDTVAAARAVLDGGERPMDLLTDDSDGIVLGGLRIPLRERGDPAGARGVCAGPGAAAGSRGPGRGPGRPGRSGGRPGRCPAVVEAGRQDGPYGAGDAGRAGGGLGARRGRVPGQRLRIEADGVLLADLDRPVRGVSVVPGGRTGAEGPRTGAADGRELAEVVVHWPGGGRPVRARARAVTVSGADFHYRADALVGGPVRTRTWTVQPAAWRLQLPRG